MDLQINDPINNQPIGVIVQPLGGLNQAQQILPNCPGTAPIFSNNNGQYGGRRPSGFFRSGSLFGGTMLNSASSIHLNHLQHKLDSNLIQMSGLPTTNSAAAATTTAEQMLLGDPYLLNNSQRQSRSRILAMLDDVKRKRELRDRRKSDLAAYLDDLLLYDDLLPSTLSHSNTYRSRYRVYQFLNHPTSRSPMAIIYHVSVFVIVFVCLILTIIATVKKSSIQSRAIDAVYLLEKVVITWFSLEFIIRLWSCSCKKVYQNFSGKIRYLMAPSRIIDLLILILTTVVLVVNPSQTGHEVFVVSAFRGFHRFFQVAQVLTLKRSLKPWKVLASVIYDQREQLFIILYTEFIVLCTLAYVAFLVERHDNENFSSIADSMWWAIVTLSTVGYGDRVPITWLGKLLSTMFTILGVAIFALPAGIIGTGLALKIEEEERNQIRNRKKVAAAVLIQRAWRCWKAHSTYELVSNWFRERPMPIFKQHDFRNAAKKFITLAQLAIARNRFRELMRPLDLNTVMQSYRDGQTEVLARAKMLQQSIDSINRRTEMSENRVANMSMKMEARQNSFELRMEQIRQLLEQCAQQLAYSNSTIERLQIESSQNRTLLSRLNSKTRMSFRQQKLHYHHLPPPQPLPLPLLPLSQPTHRLYSLDSSSVGTGAEDSNKIESNRFRNRKRSI